LVAHEGVSTLEKLRVLNFKWQQIYKIRKEFFFTKIKRRNSILIHVKYFVETNSGDLLSCPVPKNIQGD